MNENRCPKLYVTGPMSGYHMYNYPLFYSVSKTLTDHGYRVVNPADCDVDLGEIPDPQWEDYMRANIPDLLKCDGVALLPGWNQSRGATLESHIATALGLTCLPWAEWLDRRPIK